MLISVRCDIEHGNVSTAVILIDSNRNLSVFQKLIEVDGNLSVMRVEEVSAEAEESISFWEVDRS